MARSRNIKPGFFLNDTLADIHPLGRLLFIGLWTIADFKGCIVYAPRKIKAQVLPYDDCDIEELTNNLEKARFIRKYVVKDKTYIKITNFEVHQNPHKNEREAGSDIPDIEEKDNQINELKKDGTKPDKIGSTRADSLLLIPDSLPLIPDSLKAQAPKQKASKNCHDDFPLSSNVDGLNIDAWQSWLEYRRGIGKPLKPASWQAAQKAMAAFGDDQAGVVAQSIANGYQGLFALKGGAKKPVSYEAQNEAQLARLLGETA